MWSAPRHSLGPTLFLICVVDANDVSDIYCYVDYTAVLFEENNWNEIPKQVEMSLYKIKM